MSKRMARSSDEEEEVTIAEFMGKIRNIKGVKRDRQDDMNQVSMKRKREFVFKKKNVSRKELMRIRTRVSPKSFIDVIKGLNKKQKEAVEEIGFGSFIGMKLKHIPTRLGFFVVDNYDKEANCIRLGHEYLEITKDKISDAFGLPANGVEMEYLEECNKDNELLKRWNDMFGDRKKKNKDGHIEENLLNKLVENVDKIQEIDWCQFVQDCLKVSRDNWDPKAPNDTYNGPLTLLVLIYADGVKCSKHLKRRRLPLIQSWSNFDIETRERIEIAEGKFGSEGLRDDDIEDDVYVNERGSKECDTEQSLEREEDWQITVCKSNVSPVKKKIIVELQRTYNEVVKAKNKFQSTVCKALKKFPDCDIVKEFDRKVKSLYKGEVEDEDGIGIDNTSEEHEEYNDENNVSHSELQEEVDGEDVKQVQNTNKEGEDDIEVHNTNKEGEGDNNDIEEEDEREVYSIDKEGEGDDIDIQVSDTEVAEEEDGTEVQQDKRAYLSFIFKRRIPISYSVEDKVERAILSMIKKKSDVLFQSKFTSTVCVREDFESLFPKQCLYSNVIDCFARVLNYEEKYKPEGSPKRLFLGCHLLDNSVVKAVIDGNKEEFDSVFNTFNMAVINWKDEEYQSWRIGSFDMVFFPICQHQHFYLLILDMKMNKFLIVDNSSNCISTKDRYGEYPNVMLKLFSKLLYMDNHPNIESIKKLKPIRAKMPCRTKDNKYDCGIYVMRHMEDYVGQKAKDWDCGIPKDSSKQESTLRMLRKKYLCRILTSDINNSKNEVIKEYEEFYSRPLKEQDQLLREAENKIEKK
ncbi:hypothetical protein LXL04_019371 [Taraxacum kok-saghyz]